MLELQFSLLPERPYQGRTSLHGTQAIARAALQVVEVGGAAFGQLVMLQMSPDDQQRLADLLPEGAQELDDLRPLDGTGEEPEVEAAEGDPGNHRQLAPVEVVLQDRGLALRRPGTHAGGPLAQSGLVDEDDDPPLFRSVFLERASGFASSV